MVVHQKPTQGAGDNVATQADRRNVCFGKWQLMQGSRELQKRFEVPILTEIPEAHKVEMFLVWSV